MFFTGVITMYAITSIFLTAMFIIDKDYMYETIAWMYCWHTKLISEIYNYFYRKKH